MSKSLTNPNVWQSCSNILLYTTAAICEEEEEKNGLV
jgi:hypothetical protein